MKDGSHSRPVTEQVCGVHNHMFLELHVRHCHARARSDADARRYDNDLRTAGRARQISLGRDLLGNDANYTAEACETEERIEIPLLQILQVLTRISSFKFK